MLKSISESLESSIIHGISNIFKNKLYILKTIWFILFMVSLLCCSWTIKRSINDYLSFDVITLFKVNYEKQLAFPSVGICNLDIFTTDYSQRTIANLTKNPPQPVPKNIKYWVKLISNYDNLNYDKKLFGFNLTEFLLNCMFNGNLCDLSQDFEHYYDLNYGNCFRFNSGRNSEQKITYKPSQLNGLHLEFFVGDPSQNTNFLSFDTGFVIYIDNHGLDSTSIEGIKLAGGYATNIILNKYTISQIPKPYSECTSDLNTIDSYGSECYKKTFSFSKKNTYSFMDCYSMCFQKYLGQLCNCQNAKPYFDNMRKCGLNKLIFNIDYECQTGLWFQFSNNTNMFDECDCPLQCETTNYKYTTSFSKFPSYFYARKLIENNALIKSRFSHKNITYQDLANSLIAVDIFFDELKTTSINSSVKMNLVDLIANIGGALGLFLGVSFLSLVELIEIPLKCVFIRLENNSKKTYPR
jgi:hypothetical protein